MMFRLCVRRRLLAPTEGQQVAEVLLPNFQAAPSLPTKNLPTKIA